MALFYDCWQQRRSTLEELQRQLEAAKESEASERTAATDIQRVFRGQFVRARKTTQTNAQVVLARIYRGHLARRRCHLLRRQDEHRQTLGIFHYYAVILQKMMRGAHSRRTKLDFRERKAYVREIAEKGESMRHTLAQRLQQQQEQERWAHDEAARHELTQVAQNLHHLVSTRAVAGVYNSPMLASMATAFGVPVETHIRDSAKSVVVAQLAAAKPPARLKPYPPSQKASLQAAAPYGTELRAVRTHKKYHKLRFYGQRDFQAVHNSNQDTLAKLSAPGINAGVEYVDDWKNPYKKRGIPRNKDDLLPQISTLGKPPADKDKPFYLRAGGNKSKVYANDRFDV